MTNQQEVPFHLVLTGLVPICIAIANLVSGCDKRYYEQKLQLVDKATEIERIVIKDSKLYSINVLGQTNYFQYNGNFYESATNQVAEVK